ncbi:CbtA family protein [Kaarinaea lacus]
MFKRLVFSAVMSGVVVGLLITGLQSFTVIPMILDAESYEATASSSTGLSSGETNTVHSHDHGRQHAHDHDGHEHGSDEWTPEDGFERLFYTVVSNTIAAIGFALLLATCFMFLKNIDWRKGLLWGLGGFVAFQLAPSLGLPPELPGTEAAALEARQVWWIGTAVFTAIGLLLMFNAQNLLLKAIGILFIAVPQVVGAPQPMEHIALAPQSLITQFIIMTTLIGAIFWMSLGALTAYAHNKLG